MEKVLVGGHLGSGRFDAVGQSSSGWLVALACWLWRLVRLWLLPSLRVHHFVLQPLRDRLRLVRLQFLLVSLLLQLVLEPLLQFLLRRRVQLL